MRDSSSGVSEMNSGYMSIDYSSRSVSLIESIL